MNTILWFEYFIKENSYNSIFLKSSSIHYLCRWILDSNTKSSLLWLEDRSNSLHNKSSVLSLLEICCALRSSSILWVLQMRRLRGGISWSLRVMIHRVSMICGGFWWLWRLSSLIPWEIWILEERFKII